MLGPHNLKSNIPTFVRPYGVGGLRCVSTAILFSILSTTQVCAAESSNEPSLLDLSITDLLQTKVTAASLFEETGLNVASSVSVLEAKDWEKTGARRLGDALEAVPSVVTYPTWGGAEAIAIRGYATELSVRGIANTLDGVPLNTYVYATSLYDKPIINLSNLSRVEMIRGPGSTLYGSDAFHGVIAHQLRRSEQDEISIAGFSGTTNSSNASVFLSQHGSDLAFNGGIAMAKQDAQDLEYRYTDPITGNQESSERDYEYEDVSGFATFILGDEALSSLKLTTYISDYESGEFPSTGTQFFARLPGSFDVESISMTRGRDHSGQRSNFWLGALDGAHAISDDLRLEAKVYHWQSKQKWIYDNSQYPTSLTTLSAITLPCRNATNGSPNPIYCPHTLYQEADEHRSGLHLYLKSIGEQLNTQWAVGIGRDRQKVDSSDFERIALDGTTLIAQTNPFEGSKREIDFALIQAKTSFDQQRFQLVYGVRADDYSDIETHYSPRFGAIFNVTNRFTTKLLYGHAFRAPTAIERLGSVQGIEANPDIEPETIDSIEWVNVLFDQDYSLEATVFSSRWEEGIVLVPSTGVLNRYVNTGKNESYGVELSGQRQFDRFGLVAMASHVKSRNKEADTDYLAFPEWLMTLRGTYLIPDHHVEVILTQRAMFDYAEGDYLGSARPMNAPDYYRTDLSIVKNLDGLAFNGEQALYLHLYNLFDRSNTIPSLYNAEGGLVDRGFGVNLGFRFAW